jgi:hypothetical protein
VTPAAAVLKLERRRRASQLDADEAAIRARAGACAGAGRLVLRSRVFSPPLHQVVTTIMRGLFLSNGRAAMAAAVAPATAVSAWRAGICDMRAGKKK